jgi:hypothetical protein
MKKITEELNRYNSINKYISEQFGGLLNEENLLSNWSNCCKQYGGTLKASQTSTDWVYIDVSKTDVVFFKNDYSFQYQKNGKVANYGKWSCNGGQLNIKTDDGAIWNSQTKKWSSVNTKQKPIKNIGVVNPVLQQTITINKQIQQKLGITQTGKLTHNELEVLIKTLTPNATPTQQ